MQRWQEGYLYQANSSWHVRYCQTTIVDGKPKRVQKSKRLCAGDLPNKIVRQLHVEFMAKINDQNPGPSSLLADTPISLHLWKC
jgi:hypothetical protein